MIIECPDCGTKYTVREEAIKPRGRNVRCSNCGMSWHADGTRPVVEPWEERFKEDTGAAVETAVSASRSPGIEGTEEIQEETERASSAEEPEEVTAASTPIENDHDHPESESFTPHSQELVATREVEPAKSSKAVSMGLLAASVLLLAGLTFGMRDNLERAWPATTRLYDMVGFDRDDAGQGLDLRDVHAYFDPLPSGSALTIEAKVVNTENIKKRVPNLHASLVAAGGIPQQWTFGPGISVLDPQANASIKATFDGTGTQKGKILLTFSTENISELR